MYKKLQDIDLYTQKLSGELASSKLELKRRIEKLDQLHLKGLLTDAEYEAASTVSIKLMQEKIVDFDSFQSADMKTFEKGKRIIQLFQKAYEFMQIDGNSLEKIKLAKGVLSNPVLRDRTIES